MKDENKTNIDLYRPTSNDGFAVNRLVAASPPLDTNSVYCNLLQCTHYSDTSICADINGQLVGFISGYLIPSRFNTLFIWQVVVAASARGQKVATRMLRALLHRPICRRVEYLETTITRANEASWALFRRLAEKMDIDIKVSVAFEREAHFHGSHDTEQLLRIGPFSNLNALGDPYENI